MVLQVTIKEHVQEIGCAGYDGLTAEAVLFKGKLGSYTALKHVENNVTSKLYGI